VRRRSRPPVRDDPVIRTALKQYLAVSDKFDVLYQELQRFETRISNDVIAIGLFLG
jgi:hypothetical protein